MEKNIKATWKLADLASSIGLGILGFGLGAYFFQSVISVELFIIVTGLILHSIGMFFKHRLEKQSFQANQLRETSPPNWIAVIYWLCWLILAGLMSYLYIKKQS